MTDLFSDEPGTLPTETRHGSQINRTEAALLARGIDSNTASQLQRDGWTLERLKRLSDEELENVGLPPKVYPLIRSGSRPEIPFVTLIKLLIANRFTCCVCHNPQLGIIVHHIEEWSVTRDHSHENLAVLCLHHHDRAHSTSTLSQNLDASKLGELKADWESKVRALDATAILDASRVNTDAWLYFNHLRLFELARATRVVFTTLANFRASHLSKLVDANGLPITDNRDLPYMYDHGQCTLMYSYVRDVMHATLERLAILNISDDLDRSLLLPIVKAGDFVYVQGAHTFSGVGRCDSGRGQTTLGKRSANHVKLSFTFDRWEATSCSAWSIWLRGRHDVASLIRVADIQKVSGVLELQGTVIGISQAFRGMKRRDYENYFGQPFTILHDSEDDEEGIQL